jgi:hypothetical protein
MPMFAFFRELRRQLKLSAKRHPMYDQNKFGKIMMYFAGVFWAGYLMFFGSLLAFAMNSSSNMESYHLMNKYLLVFLILDFLLRFMAQPLPTQEMKPYLLLPVKRNRLIDFLLIRSGMSGANTIWLFFFVPFAMLCTIPRYFGFTGIISYIIGVWLLFIFNNYFTLLCRTLMKEKIWWIGLPVVVYGGLVTWLIVGDDSLQRLFMNLGEGYIMTSPWAFLLTIALIVGMWMIDRTVLTGLVHSELTKQADTKKQEKVSEYKIFDKYGEVGEYMRLELKLTFRNKRPKASFNMIGGMVIIFSILLSFTDIYNGAFMSNFIAIYNFSAFGLVSLAQVMSYEGNYIDGLMTRKESVYSLLRAKYYMSVLFSLIPLILTLPAAFTDKVSFLQLFAYLFFVIGFIHFMLFQGVVYCNKSAPLNENMSGRQNSGTAYQQVMSLTSFGLPLAVYFGLSALIGETVTLWILLVMGILFVLTSTWWIKNIYNRFMARRYRNMEGFRDTK